MNATAPLDHRDRCAIVGIGETDYSRNSGRSDLTLATQAALAAIEGDRSAEAALARQVYEATLAVAGTATPQGATSYERLKLEIIPKQREALRALRDHGEIGEEAYHRLLEELDWAELAASPAGRFQPLATD